MRKIHLILGLFIAVALFSGCNGYRETSHGVVSGVVKVEALSDNVIRVCATDSRFFKTENEKISYRYPKDKFWEVEYMDDGSVALVTSKIQACIDIQTGKVTFKDASGNVLLKEKSRKFDTDLRQFWESDGNETFLGFGNCISDAYMPIVISSDNYGIVWSSNSDVRWGDSREYLQLNELFRVYDEAGAQGGLSAYYTSEDGENFYRTEPFLFFENDETNAEFLPDVKLNGSTVVMNGALEPYESGLFGFRLHYSGYIEVYMDDTLLIPEKWHPCNSPSDVYFKYPMEKAERTAVRIVWRPDGDNAYCSLRTVSPLPSDENGTISFWSKSGNQIEYFFVAGDNLDEVSGGCSLLLDDTRPADTARNRNVALRWEELQDMVSKGVNASLSGDFRWTLDLSDAGVERHFKDALKESLLPDNKTVDLSEWHELLTRWYQFGTFCPEFQGVSFNDPSFRTDYFEELRNRITPYIHSISVMADSAGYVMMRHLAMDFNSDPNALKSDDQYMLGPALMVCPVYKDGSRSRIVYLPENEGGWYDFRTGAYRRGGSSFEVNAALDQIPVFSPAGAIVPMKNEMEDIAVFSGKDGKFVLTSEDNYSVIVAYDDDKSELGLSSVSPIVRDFTKSFRIRLYTPYGMRTKYVEYKGDELKVEL